MHITCLSKLIVTCACALAVAGPVSAATIRVTSPNLTGPGSLLQAVERANSLPGSDTIEIDAGLRIDLTSFDIALSDGVVKLTESVTIEGNGSTVFSTPTWVDTSGGVNNDSAIDNPRTIIVSPAMRFLNVGTLNQDNTAIEVTVRNLRAEKLNGFAVVEENASLTVEDVTMTDFRAVSPTERSFIESRGASSRLTLRNTTISGGNTFADLIYAGDSFYVFSGGISGQGTLVMENVTMRDNQSAGALLWTEGSVTVVSSRFVETGGFEFEDGQATIVNSVFDFPNNSDDGQNSIVAGPGAVVDLVASTVRIDFHGNAPGAGGLGDYNGQPLQAWGGSLNLVGSAVYGGQAGEEFGPFPGIAYYATQGGSFTADDYSWASPVDDQDAAALEDLFNNPNLRTDGPGLSTYILEQYPQSVTPLLGTPGMPGVLIDIIPDAGPGGVNELVNPIDGMPILVDALGNPRVDGNGFRNIGAVQLSLAPHLVVDSSGDEEVDLSWSRPGVPFDSYTLEYRVDGTPDWASLPVPGDVSGVKIESLTNGVTYEFRISAVSAGVPGPPSNTVQATPYGTVHAPDPTALAGAHQVELSWQVPAAGGYTIIGYGVYYRLAGPDEWIYFGYTTETGALVTGLQAEQAYEFGIETITAEQQSSSGLGTTTATTLEEDLFAYLCGEVGRLGAQGFLNRGQTNSLLVKLKHAQQKTGRNQPHVAVRQLEAFGREVHAFVAAGILSREQGDDLLMVLGHLLEDLKK